MGMRINTNTSSIAAQRTLAEVSRQSEDALAKLSSGTRINKASDDAAGLAISEKLKGHIRSMSQANRNANDGISMVQTAEGGLNEVQNILVRLRELSIQSASDTVGDTERAFTDLEYQALKDEITRISDVTEFNGLHLLNGQGEDKSFQIGINNNADQDRIVYKPSQVDAGLDSLGLGSIDASSKEGAQDSLAALDSAIEQVSGQRAFLGAVQNRLVSTSRNLEISVENLSGANSRIRDIDYAAATADNTRLNILKQANTSVLTQANQNGNAALRLIG